jgi:hypothetical protein
MLRLDWWLDDDEAANQQMQAGHGVSTAPGLGDGFAAVHGTFSRYEGLLLRSAAGCRCCYSTVTLQQWYVAWEH